MPTVLAQSNLPKNAAVVVSSETIILRDPNNSILKKYTSEEQKQLSLESYGVKPTTLLSPGENETIPDSKKIIFYRWLQNNGEACINSMIKPKSVYKYEFAINYVSGSNPYIFGAADHVAGSDSNFKSISAYIYNASAASFGMRIYMKDEGSTFASLSGITNSFEKIVIEDGKIYVNDVEKATISTYNPETALDTNLFIFSLATENIPSFRGSLRLAYFKIYDENGNLLRDFVPASRDEDFGLYDKVTRALFVKASGDGSFIGGNDENIIPNSGPLGFGNIDTPDVIDNDGETI